MRDALDGLQILGLCTGITGQKVLNDEAEEFFQ